MSIVFHPLDSTKRHRWSCAALSPDGRLLASAGLAIVELLDPESGQSVATLRAGRDRVLALAFSEDGAWLFAGTDSADEGYTLWRWRLESQQEQGEPVLAHARTCALHCHADRLISGGGEDDGEWILWSLPDLTRAQESGPAEGEVLGLTLDETGWSVLRCISGETHLEICDADRRLRVPVEGDARWIALAPGGQSFLVGLAEHVVALPRANASRGKRIQGSYLKANLRGQIAPLGDTWFGPGISRAGDKVACCHDGRLTVYCGKRTLWSSSASGPLRALVSSPTHLAGCRGDTALLWRANGDLLWSRRLECQPVRLALDPWARWLVALGETLTYLRLETGEIAHCGMENLGAGIGKEEDFASMRFAPEVTFAPCLAAHPWTPVAIGSDRDLSLLWDGRSLNLKERTQGPRFEGFTYATHAFLGQSWVVIAGDQAVGLYERDSGRLLGYCQAAGMAGSGLAVGLDGRRALRSTSDRVEVWDLANSSLVGSWPAPEPIWSWTGLGSAWAGGLSGMLYRVELSPENAG